MNNKGKKAKGRTKGNNSWERKHKTNQRKYLQSNQQIVRMCGPRQTNRQTDKQAKKEISNQMLSLKDECKNLKLKIVKQDVSQKIDIE